LQQADSTRPLGVHGDKTLQNELSGSPRLIGRDHEKLSYARVWYQMPAKYRN